MATEHHGSFWTSPKQIFGTTNAEEIARLYFVLSLINAAIGGMYAIMMRVELWDPLPSMFKEATDYNIAFTLHGTAMIFLVIVPLAAGFGNLLIPRMVASLNNDMYWPKWNNVAFWMLPVGSAMIWGSQAYGGWTAYPPLSLKVEGIDFWILGLILVGTSSTIGAFNFILTIWKGRAPYVKWMDMDMFVWGTLLTSILVTLATPVLTTALFMVFFDRNLNTAFFDRNLSNPVMYQHIFWFYSHPAVYIMVLPAFSLVTTFIAKFSRRPIFGYKGILGGMVAITSMSFIVWAHHMYTTGIDPFVRFPFNLFTYIIAIPSGVLVFFWITNLYKGRIKFEAPMLFSLSFIIMFTIGGITGEYLNDLPLDLVLHDSYWVVGHFHFVVAAGTFQALFAAFYYYYPDMTGKMYDKTFAKIHFWTWSLGNIVAFSAFTVLGLEGMPRRYFTYPPKFQFWHQVATVGGFLMGIGFIFFFMSMMKGWMHGKPVENMDDPFGIGSGYDFPKPFAEHMKEVEGKDIHVEHKLSFWSPVGAIALSFPLLAAAAFLELGPFKDAFIVSEQGFMARILPPAIWGFIFLVTFIVFLALLFFFESGARIGEVNPIDQYKSGRNWEIWVFLLSEVIFFGAIIGASLAIRLNSQTWPDPHEYLDVNLTAVNTFILIISSFTMAMAVNAIKMGNVKKMNLYLLATIVLGSIFLSVQIFEYIALFNEGEVALIETAKFKLVSSTFFIQTGFHGAHVFVGILFLFFVWLRGMRGGFTKERHEAVEFIGLYWHFVDLVWVFLFTIIYLM